MQLYSSPKPLHNNPSSVFWYVNICYLPFLNRTSIQKWKKNWFCHLHKWIGKKEMLTKIPKCLCWNLFIGAAAKLRIVYKDHKILVILKRCITLSFKSLDLQHNISNVLWLLLTKTFFVYLVTVQIRPMLLIWEWTVRN